MNFDLLREVILERAIQGKLVPQLESEPDVVSTGTAPNNAPLDIPNKWKWVQIKSIEVKRKIIEPHSLVDDEVELWSIPSYDIGKAQVVPPSTIGSNKKIVFAGDVLLAKIVPHIKRAWVVSEENTSSPKTKLASTEWLIYRSAQFLPDFLVLLFKSPYFRSKMTESISGMGSLKRANPKAISKIWVPLPPKKEQARIISKVNDLLYNVNFIEKAYKELIALQDLLQKQILRKAIHGRLVPQLENEPYVVQVGEKPYNAPFTIPDKWKWVQLRAVGKIVGGGTPRTNIPEYWNHGVIPWFTPADLGKVTNIYVETSSRKITTKGLANSSATMMPKNTILFSSRAPIGYIALATENCCTNQGCKSFVANESVILPMWAYWVLKARTPDIVSRASGTTFKEISSRGMGDTWIPLPPMAEQKRIIAKIQELFDIGKKILFDRYNVVKISKE